MAPKQNQPTPQKRPEEDFSLKETSPNITGGRPTNVPVSVLDLVEQMLFLFVKVEKATNLPENCNPYVEVKLGNYKGITKHLENIVNPEWKQIFAFSKDRIQATSVEIFVMNKDISAQSSDLIIGRIVLHVSDVPHRVLPDGQLATQWYRLDDQNGVKLIQGEIMLAAWMGTQADEAYSIAWHSDASSVNGNFVVNTRSIIYNSPKLWYLRVNVIEAQDLVLSNKNRKSEVVVEAQLGRLKLTSRVSERKTINPLWNEDIMFVTEDPSSTNGLILVIKVVDRVAPNKFEVLGICKIDIKDVEKRIDATPPSNIWYDLQRPEIDNGEGEIKNNELKFASKLHMRISLDGGYHVLEEPTHYASDLRPSSRVLWRPSIGVLELGILSANGLLPMKSKENRTDAYCVAKYGMKWARTRTIVDNYSPKWNEQYTWEVYDPCTVLTVGVFDNGILLSGIEGIDKRIGKVRIRLSTLETDRVYTHSYPLVGLLPSGVKKMGEIQLVVRFSSLSLINTLHTYTLPLFPKMHYKLPLSIFQIDHLRHQCITIISERLEKAEPKLRREVVHYMLDADSHIWSIRKAKSNFDRIVAVLEGLVSFCKWFDRIRSWTNPISTVLTHLLLLVMVFSPNLIVPTIFFYLLGVGIWQYRSRPRQPPYMDTKLSHAYTITQDEIEEEFDSFPSKASGEVLRRRYDRLRHIGGKLQVVIGDLATQGERVQSLLSWRDPRATSLFLLFCLVAGILIYMTPFKFLVVSMSFYVLRHPRFRFGLPSFPQNFLRRMPARTDSML